ncbi:MAG: DUF1634 domain-containing protein [Coleofasciculus sp. G3-WIS-01]|uniref:DUF1634 domain-containing protein n=1 Tax=Coleofasciculus sp. G3-WIS-01 TaxID=3069528 RepID=UPI0032F0FE62
MNRVNFKLLKPEPAIANSTCELKVRQKPEGKGVSGNEECGDVAGNDHGLDGYEITDLSRDFQVNDQESATESANPLQLEQWIGNLLNYGVILSSSLVLVGGILYLIRHGFEPVNYRMFQGEPAEFRSPVGVIQGVLSGRRRGIIQLGLLVLIATPILRVAFSCMMFIRQRDWTYTVLTWLVLFGLIYSFVGAYY